MYFVFFLYLCTPLMTIKRITYIKEFEQLYRENYTRMYHYSLSIVGDKDHARDIVSETFTKLWDDYDLLYHKNITVLLMTMVRNRSIDFLRTEKRQKSNTERIINALYGEHSYEEREQKLQSIEREIQKLPALTRDVLIRCYYQHKKYAEVAEELNITQRMVKRHIVNALAKLRLGVHNDKL